MNEWTLCKLNAPKWTTSKNCYEDELGDEWWWWWWWTLLIDKKNCKKIIKANHVVHAGSAGENVATTKRNDAIIWKI